MSFKDVLIQVLKYLGFGAASGAVLAAEHYWGFDAATGNLMLGSLATLLGIKVLNGVLSAATTSTLSVPPVLIDAVHTNTDALALNTQVTSQNTVTMLNQGKVGTP